MNPSTASAGAAAGSRFATLAFTREIAAPASTLWQVWTAPAARAAWCSPSPSARVEIVEADTRRGGREVSLCREEGMPDSRCDIGWLEIEPERRTVNSEIVSREGQTLSAALVTAEVSANGSGSRLDVTVQLASLAGDMEAEYRQGFGHGLDHLAEVAGRTMILQRVIAAPRRRVWDCWMNPETLPQWWGPEGYSCRTQRIDLRQGGEWVFDMISADGQVFPNHHQYTQVQDGERLAYRLLWGENGPKHADAWAAFEDVDGKTRVTLGMVFTTLAEYRDALGFGAYELGLETLGKLDRFVQGRA
jgi:uncharacterized protein YndB with AHSA1/START domain